MVGRRPKPAHLRQRTNRTSTHATLEARADGPVPPLPKVKGQQWSGLTRGWWARVWASPMAGQYLETDVDGLGRLAVLVEAYYAKPSVIVLAEIRQQEARFGLSPLDRSRLQWSVAQAETAEQKRKPAEQLKRASGDPRRVLSMVAK